MSTKTQIPRRYLGLAMVLFLLGCAQAEESPPCLEDGACPPPSESLVFAAQLLQGKADARPEPGRVLTPQEEVQLRFDASGHVTLAFAPSVALRGTVLDENGRGVSRARVVARLPWSIPGQPDRSFETTTDGAGSFALRVPLQKPEAMQPFRIWVGFDDTDLSALHPPLWKDGVFVKGDTHVQISLRKASERATVYGRVLDGVGLGVPGMRVQVVDDRREVVSSTMQSRSPNMEPVGAFRLQVDPSLGQGRLTLVAHPNQPGYPTLTLPLPALDAATSLSVDLKIPPYRKAVDVTLVVQGTGPSGATLRVPSARVIMRAFLPDPLPASEQSTMYEVSGETNESGEVRLPLVPAISKSLQYTVVVQSPASALFASSAGSLAVGTELGGTQGRIVLPSLPLRAQVSGRLVDGDGRALSAVQIFARRIAEPGQMPQIGGTVLEPVMPQSTTDDNGRFALRPDQGTYDLDIVPRPLYQPRFSLENQRILTDDIELGVLKLPRPALGRALVLGPDRVPVAGATLRIFQIPEKMKTMCSLMVPCSQVAPLRAEVSTDSQGRAMFLLPDK